MNGQTVKKLRRTAKIKWDKTAKKNKPKSWWRNLMNFFKKNVLFMKLPEPNALETWKHFWKRVKRKWNETPWNERR